MRSFLADRPRALEGRSILASPIPANMQATLNEIKDREDFRPVAPVVLEEEASRWFTGARPSPFMLFVYPVATEMRERIPAVRHVDGTARIQTINKPQPASPVLRSDQSVLQADGCPGAREHVVQYQEPADRMLTAGRDRMLHDIPARCAGDRLLPAR